MYLFLTLDPCNCWWLHMDLPPSWVQRFHCRKWCDVKSCARDQLVTSWKGSAGIFSTKNSSERSLDSALRYRIHIRPSPIAKLPPNPLLPLFFRPTPKPLSWPTSTSGPGWRFTLGRNSICSGPMSGKAGNGKISIAWDRCSSPPKGRKNIWISHGFYAQNGDFLCFFFLAGDVMDQKKSASTKKCQQLQPKSPGKSMIFPNFSRPFASRRPRTGLGHVSSWESARNGCGNEQGRGIGGIHGSHLMVTYPSVKKRLAPRKMVRMMTTNKKYILQISELLFWSVTLEWTRQKGRTIWCLLNFNDDLLIDQNSGSKFRFAFAAGSATFSKMASAKCTLVEGHGWVPNSGFGDRGVVFFSPFFLDVANF